MATNELNILSLDSGGIRSLSTLHILKALMESIDPTNPPKPCDFFDMIGGTGSGGLLAIMLGRLKMDVDQVITGYTRLCGHVFKRDNRGVFGRLGGGLGVGRRGRKKRRFERRKVEFALKSILKELGHSGEERDLLLQDVDLSCRVFICVTDTSTNKLIPLSSYPSKYCPSELYKSTKIWEAGVASFAHTSLFEPIPLGPSRRRYADASAQANNPIREAWIEAKNVWKLTSLEHQLRCLVSIGTGLPTIQRASQTKPGVFGSLSSATRDKVASSAVIDPEIEADKFVQEHSELDDDGRLFRFDVPNGLGDIALDDLDEVDTVVDATKVYLGKELVYKQVRRCAAALARPGDSEVGFRR
ncbi:uncharacterized protein BDV14DRAFT_177410 [Aspergillus stella-maris]|uniref:uncharacterized protein n=1 Tax=Aspergillus stella-maris TaxID=1810926 RepID=UPI003CCE418A